MSLRGHNSTADYARQLFTRSKDLASLQACRFSLDLGFGFFVSDIICGVV